MLRWDRSGEVAGISVVAVTIRPLSRLDDETAARLAELEARQAGVARRSTLVALGVPPDTVDYLVESRRWQSDGGGLVVVMHNGPLTTAQQAGLAVLAGGRLCALAARSAAAHAGLQGWPAHAVEVVVPRGTTYPRLDLVSVRVHESRRFTESDVHPVSWPPRVRVERALVDAASWSARPRTACGVLAAGVQQRLTQPDRLITELENAGRIKFGRLLRRALVDIEGGAAAVSEIDFTRFCSRNGLPTPIRQLVRRDAAGHRRYLDATLVGPTGIVVRVEIDGALHLVVQTYWDDMSRDNDLAIAGELVLRLPSFVVHSDDGQAVGQLRRALGMSGPHRQTAA